MKIDVTFGNGTQKPKNTSVRGGRGVINSGKWANVVYGWPIIGSDTSSVASRARTELTSSKCD